MHAKSQTVFADSIRSMLIDLDSSIQYVPINKLLKQSIAYCNGVQINDSLRTALKQLLSEDYLLLTGLRQAVSPHLITRYTPLFRRISFYIAETENNDNAGNLMRVAMVLIRGGLLIEARNILFHINDSSAIRYYYLAQTYTDAYKPDSIYILYNLALEKNRNRSIEESLLYANTLFSLAGFCYAKNKRDTAFHLYQQHLNLRKKIHDDNSSEYAYWMIVTADMYTYLSKYSLALELDVKALELAANTAGKRSWLYALCLGAIGEVYYSTGEYDKALPFTQQSLELKKQIFGNEYFDNVVSLHNLATLYIRTGLYNEAVPLLEESLFISKKYFGEKLVYAVDLHPLAEVYEYMGEYDKSLPLYQRSISIHRQLQKEDGGSGRNVFYPRVLHSIACLYTKLGQYDKAIEYFKQALLIKKEVATEMNPDYTKTLNAYAETCLLKGDYNKALSLQQRSLSIARKIFGETHPDVAAGLYNLSVLYYRQNNLVRSEAICNQALKMQMKIFGATHPDVAVSLDMLGSIKTRQKYAADTSDYFRRSFDIRKNIMPATHPGYITSLYNLGNDYNRKGMIRQGEQYLMQADSAALLHIEQSYIALSEDEKLIYLRNTEKQFQYLPSLLYLKKTSNPEIVNRVYRDALVLKSMVLFHQQQVYNSIRQQSDSIALQMYNGWRFNKAFLGQQLLLPSGKRYPGFDSLQDATIRMEESLSRTSASFKINRLQYGSDINQVAQRLAGDAAAIEFIRFRLFNNNWTDSIIYAAVVLLPGTNNAAFVPLCEERELKKLLRFSNNRGAAAVGYLYPAAGAETDVSRELYRLVWKPLQSSLKGIRTVYYSPAGLLFKLSFAAIHSGKGKLLTDEYNLMQLVCTRNIAREESSTGNFKTAALWGDIDYGTTGISPGLQEKSWKPLPGTRSEIAGISSLLQQNNISCKKESAKAASEVSFKKMDGHSPELLHIATHGFFLPRASAIKDGDMYEQNTFSLQQNPMLRNGLLLAGSNAAWAGKQNIAGAEDGVLTAYEISHLDLGKTKLVTLSACETAIGEIEDNEGVFGLQRAFKMAGVKQVLMSLWAVPDKETGELMKMFYSSLLKSNDANKALHTAQLAMKEKYPPYYWAGFVLTE
jgi:CHAT domain-containing protein/Tfp pilus assembly protein PilF